MNYATNRLFAKPLSMLLQNLASLANLLIDKNQSQRNSDSILDMLTKKIFMPNTIK